jgi:hypothetical protein
MDTEPPEAVEAMVLEETAHVVAQYWSATGRPAPEVAAPEVAANGDQPATRLRSNGNGGRHLRRPAPGRAGRHERRR